MNRRETEASGPAAESLHALPGAHTRTVTLRGADNRPVLLNRDDIDELAALPISLMPENQMVDLKDQDIRDLFAYLMSRAPGKTLSAK